MSKLLDKSLIDELEGCKDLPTPPAIATQILELSARSCSNIETLAEIVSFDPALSAKIIGMANSSLYMRRMIAGSVQQAVLMFGWTGTLNIALSFSVVGSIRANMETGLDYDYFWLRSLGAAVTARLFGTEQAYIDREKLFLAGLLQDIGVLVLDRLRSGLYARVDCKQKDHRALCEREFEWVGVDHSAVGEWLLKTWRLPDSITRLVGTSHQHSVSAEDIDIRAQQCIYLSGLLADCICGIQSVEAHEKAFQLMQTRYGYTVSDFVLLLETVAAQLQEVVSLFDVKMPEMLSFKEIVAMSRAALEA